MYDTYFNTTWIQTQEERKMSVVNDGDDERVEQKQGEGKRDIATKSGGVSSSEDEKLKKRAAR